MVKLGGRCRTVTALGLTGGQRITLGDVVRSPQGIGTIAREFLAAAVHLKDGVSATLLHHRLPKVGKLAVEDRRVAIGHTPK